MGDIQAIFIKPNRLPQKVLINNDLLIMNELVNVDRKGNPCTPIETFEIVEIKDNINIISSPKHDTRYLPVVRQVGRFTKFYGVMYIVKMDDSLNLVSLTNEEVLEYSIKFTKEIISFDDLGLPSIDYQDDDCSDDSNKSGRITITFDEW